MRAIVRSDRYAKGTSTPAARRRPAQESAIPPHLRFFFVHMMKTGGTTFGWQARANFRPDEVFPQARRDDPFRSYLYVSEPLSLPTERRDRVRLFMGHYPLMVSDLLGGGFVTMTILRDPVERTISFLQHWRRLQGMESQSLEQVYDDDFAFRSFIQDHQARLLSFTPEDHPESFLDPIDIDPGRLRIAAANLDRVEVVGVHAHYLEFLRELEERFSWRFEPIGELRVSDPVGLPQSFRRRIADDNPADMAVYEQALARRRSRLGRS